jgi:uncharacterized coiled-coil DUF342 family protein
MFVLAKKYRAALAANKELAQTNDNLVENYAKLFKDAKELKNDLAELQDRYRVVIKQREDLRKEKDLNHARVVDLIREQDACHNWIGGFADKYKMMLAAVARDVDLLHTSWHCPNTNFARGEAWPWEEE